MKPIHYAIARIGDVWHAVVCDAGNQHAGNMTRELARVTCPDCLARLASISRGGA